MRGRRGCVREGGGKGLVCISVLRVCFLVRIDCQRWYEMHVGGLFDLVWVRVTYLVWKFGLNCLWVDGYSFCENVHAGCHCDPRDAHLAVRLCTIDGAPADCVELNHQNQGGPKSECGHYPGKRRVRGRDGVV